MADRIGRQEPVTEWILPYTETDGPFAVEVYEMSGRTAYEWQRGLIYDMMAINASGQYLHLKFGYAVPRQNGKNEVVVMRELAGLMTGERILHTAHLVDTAHKAFERIVEVMEEAGLKRGRDFSTIKAKGQEQIVLTRGGTIDFRTRTQTGGLGASYDVLVIDEAQEYTEAHESALQYTIAASKRPQTILCGTPPTPISAGTVFQQYRTDVLSGQKADAGWAEWSVSEQSDVHDINLWYQTNPSLGLRLQERTVANEITETDGGRLNFNIQRLGLWVLHALQSAIPREKWDAGCVQKLPEISGKIAVGIKYNRDGLTVSAAVAGKTKDGKIFSEVVGRRQVVDGTEWITELLRSIGKNAVKVVVDGATGTELLKKDVKAAGLPEPVEPKAKEVIEAAAKFETGIHQATILHMDQPSVSAVVTACQHRPIGTSGGFGFRPIDEARDVSLMEAMMLACWGVDHFKQTKQIASY